MIDLNRLIRWGDYQYLALMNSLVVFDDCGDMVAEWTVTSTKYDWSFNCVVNTLPNEVKCNFEKQVADPWKQYVDDRLMEFYHIA